MNIDFAANLSERIASSGLLGQAEGHLLTPSTAKYVRPQFLFACGKVLGVAQNDLVDFAAAVELMHTATLIHDDIIDEAAERRSLPSVNERFGSKFAVLAGDGMLAQSLAILASGKRPEDAARTAANTLTKMVEAVALELELRNAKPTEDQLVAIVDGKTGALFALCGYLAGIAADNDKAADELSHVGMLTGRVFQIMDDMDDMDEDRKNEIPTLPTLMDIEKSRNQISDSLSEIDATLSRIKTTSNEAAAEQLSQIIHAITRSATSS